jgi:FkbM family methyltransferase
MTGSIDMQLPTVVVDSIFGPMVAFEGDFATRQIEEFGAHTRNEIALLRLFVDAGELVYDIGAHIGSFAIPLAEAVGEQGKVIAVEADVNNFPALWQNLRRRDLIGRVAPLCGVAGGQAGRFTPRRVERHTSATYFVADPAGAAAVTFALDDLHACFAGGRRVAVIKIDVEGMELSVLRSAQRMIELDRPVLYFEVVADQMARFGFTARDVEAFLRPFEYRLFRNIGERNSTNDAFTLAELQTLAEGGGFFDVLAIPIGSAKLARVEQTMGAAKAR